MKIIILVGTRPELIKVAPIMRELNELNIPYIFVHSNQHYSEIMDKKIMEDLEIRKQDYDLDVGSGTHAVQTAKLLKSFEKVCDEVNPDIVLVHGDTNTTLAGALVAKKKHILVGHIEAGLRSFDMKMPEEVNRVMIDRISDFCFAPTETAKQHLLNEGVSKNSIFVTGNTVVDALKQHVSFVSRSNIFNNLNIDKKEKYILVTAHRPENVDNKESLTELLSLLEYAQGVTGYKTLFLMHPRTKKQLDSFSLKVPDTILSINPVGYIDMLALMSYSSLVMTDSGGLQEESYILEKPLMTMRDSTERPETLSANFLIHTNKQKFDNAWKKYLANDVSWGTDFGEGNASKEIIKIMSEYKK